MDERRFRPPGSPPSMLSALTHELRTPLNSILMMSELLAEGPEEHLAEREGRYARNIHHAAQDLLELVNQAGEIARVESGRMTVEARSVATADIARRVEEDQREVAEALGTELSVEVADGAPASVVTDPAKLVRAAALVIGAALQASKGGAAEATFLAPAGGGPGLALRVVDSGPAISESDAAALFVAFGAVGPRTARRFGGTGLGLPVAWALTRLLGGDLSAHPAGAIGCRFTLSVPGGPTSP